VTLVTAHRQPSTVPPHAAVVAAMSCPEDRLELYHHDELVRLGGGFPITMAGGGAALLTRRDRDSAIGQWTDLYGVDRFEEGIIRMHLHCGKMSLLAADNWEIFYLFNPTSVEDLYRLGDMGADKVREALYAMYFVDVPIRVEVIDIIRGPDGRPTGVLMPRP
jgi:hypothetical protein